MPDKVHTGLLARLVSIVRVWIACARNGSIYSPANHTNGEICDDKEKDKQYDEGGDAF
jgi:hypothetical protein